MITVDGKNIPVTPYDGPVALETAVLRDREIVDVLRARIAALEKCIEARDALMDHVKTSIPFYFQKCCKPYRDAIRRADEEAGRS